MGILTGGRVFFQGHFRELDVIWDNQGVIQELVPHGLFSPSAGEEHFDASGKAVLPGLVDVHVHFRDPGLEHKEGWKRGSSGALHGGVTSVLEVQNNPPLSVDPSSYSARIQYVTDRSHIDFGLYPNLLAESAPHLKDMAPLAPAFKLFMGGSTGLGGQLDYGLMRDLFRAAAAAGRQVVVHAEEESILRADRKVYGAGSAATHHLARSAVAETVSIAAAIEMAADADCELHIFHVSTARGVELIDEAKRYGLPVTGSTCPHYLIFTSEDVARAGNSLKVNPSIKGPRDRRRLLEGIDTGVIEVIGTDHAPHPSEEKEREYRHAPSGIPSVDLLFPLLRYISKREEIILPKLIDATSHAPARIFCLMQKGEIEIGQDADLAIFDEEQLWEVDPTRLPSACDHSPYAGWQLNTGAEMVFLRGQVVLAGGEVPAAPSGKPIVFEVPRYWG